MPSTAIIGPQASGKKLTFEVIKAGLSGERLWFQSAPVARIKTADRYIVVGRSTAAQSLYRRDRVRRGLPGTTWQQCLAKVERGQDQVLAHVENEQVFWLDYRDLIERLAVTVERLAAWLDREPWPVTIEIYDGDVGLCR